MEEELTEEQKFASCRQAECPVRSSGKCLEGLEPETCSHFYWASVEDADESQNEEQSQNTSGPVLKLFKGMELQTSQIGLVTNQYSANIIIIIGESFSGKSTILTSIFDMFQVGKFSQYYFAGSLTQYGFETRCHLSRAPSGLDEPDTDKTTSKDFNFLHMAYKDVDSLKGKAHHLLLSDISGERFKMANASADMMHKMSLVKMADHLVYLLDGEKLKDKLEANAVITRAGQFMTRALDIGLFSQMTKLMVVFTKADLIEDMFTDGRIDKIKNDLLVRFGNKLKDLSFEIIAARPKPPTDKYPFGFNLDKLLTLWKHREAIALQANLNPINSDRYFDNYTFKNG